jgi:antitoxin (DNA-binding transcriptional repressor) of toxin-antitoxin stability system
MKTISIRELHLKTGRWVRHAASRGLIVVTDRGRRVAALQPFDASVTGRPLPNREAAIRKRSLEFASILKRHVRASGENPQSRPRPSGHGPIW